MSECVCVCMYVHVYICVYDSWNNNPSENMCACASVCVCVNVFKNKFLLTMIIISEIWSVSWSIMLYFLGVFRPNSKLNLHTAPVQLMALFSKQVTKSNPLASDYIIRACQKLNFPSLWIHSHLITICFKF